MVPLIVFRLQCRTGPAKSKMLFGSAHCPLEQPHRLKYIPGRKVLVLDLMQMPVLTSGRVVE
jgi:hypothetical protein